MVELKLKDLEEEVDPKTTGVDLEVDSLRETPRLALLNHFLLSLTLLQLSPLHLQQTSLYLFMTLLRQTNRRIQKTHLTYSARVQTHSPATLQ